MFPRDQWVNSCFSPECTYVPSWGHSSFQWRHNERDCVSNHRLIDCLLNRLFRRRSKKTSKLRVHVLCEGNSAVTGEFPAQRPVTRKCFHLKTSSWNGTHYTKDLWTHNWNLLVVRLNLLNKQSSWRWFESPWPVCDDTVMSDVEFEHRSWQVGLLREHVLS